VWLNYNEYTNKELTNCIKFEYSTVKGYTRKLIEMNLVSFSRLSKINLNEKVYSLTKKGYDVINEIISDF